MKFFTTSRISENMHETPEGYLVCLGVAIARTGEMIYGAGETPLEVGEDGKIIVSRTSTELFRSETVASFEGKSFTIKHPDDFLSPENWASLTHGIGYNVRRGIGEQENDLVCDILITTKRAIELVKGGLREISCGYEAEYLQTGAGRGEQKNILGNHLALVEEGRAGASYAIHDHKGKGSMKLKDSIKKIFAKAQDDALSLVTDEKTADEKDAPVDLSSVMDAIAKLDKKVKDMTVAPTQSTAATTVAGDVEGAAPATIEERMAKLEALVASVMEKISGTADADKKDEKKDDEEEKKDDEEETKDDDGDDDETEDADEECEDEDYETADTASRVEILAPGMNAEAKDVKRKALVACYATKDGKSAIEQFTGGKAPNFKNDKTVDTLFVGVSEVLKTHRNATLASSRTKDGSGEEKPRRVDASKMTADKMNEINSKRYPQ